MLPTPPLLLITDRSQAAAPLERVVAAALEGGVRWVSLREKDLPEDAQITLARALAARARSFGARILIHGPARLAVAAGLDGVHLAAGEDAAAARALLGADALIGQSIHGAAEAQAAEPGILDYVVAGPVFETRSKPGYGPALEAEGLRRLSALCRVPLLALGGIEEPTIAPCRAAGVAGVAVMGGIMRAADARAESQALIAAWEAATGLTTD